MKTNLNICLSIRPPQLMLRLTGVIIWSICLVALTLLALSPTRLQAQEPDTGYIVVQFDERQTIVRQISFQAPISGFAALQRAGLNISTTVTGFGPGVCAIEGVGDSAANCFSTGFWAYSFWDGTQWQAYPVGAGDSVVPDGRIELWAWSPNFTSPPSPGIGPQFVSAAKATRWLASQQSSSDGGYNNLSNSLEALMAIGANGYQGATWRQGLNAPSLLGYVMAQGADYSALGGAATGKLAVSLAAGEGCYPYDTHKPHDFYLTSTGVYTGGFGIGGGGAQSWSILGTRALSDTVPSQAVAYLKSIINSDGGWGWELGASDTNGTALAIQALLSTGESITSTVIISGLNYLKSTQNLDGGFPYDPADGVGNPSDTNSTAYVVQAIYAAGQDPLTGTWLISNTNPISYLLRMQLPDGSFAWQSNTGPSQIATQQAIPALLGRPFPVRVADVATCQFGFLPVILKN